MKNVFVFFFILLLNFSLSVAGQVKNVKHVVMIGADGFGAFMLREHPEDFTTIRNMMQNGSSSLEMRTVLPSSSACNWASIMMGASPELHGYTTWGSKSPDLPSRVLNQYGMFPGIFGELRAKYPKAELGYLYQWDGMGYLFDRGAASYEFHAKNGNEEMCQATCDYITKRKPMFTFAVFDHPDGEGHSDGWGSPKYHQMCQEIDGYVAKILKSIQEAGMMENTVVIFIADHGGIEKGHGGKTMQEMQVPFVLFGAKVKKNYVIDRSLMIYDTASTIAHLFGVEQPQVWIGRPCTEIFTR
ncbi:MAG: alkaline phosphatase [Breznakibacter sp.]|nr:alkaline phosphatase [Breznakibacter sp.]